MYEIDFFLSGVFLSVYGRRYGCSCLWEKNPPYFSKATQFGVSDPQRNIIEYIMCFQESKSTFT